MVSSINASDSSQIQQLMAQMMQKMKNADTDGTSGLSKDELSSVDAGEDKGGVRFLKELSKNFDKIDSNSDGQLTDTEIEATKPKKPPMGPPPGMFIENMSSYDTDETEGLSKDELSSIDSEDDKGLSKIVKNLTKNFDKIDSNSDGQLSSDEIEKGKPKNPPPPPQEQSNNDSGSSDSLSSNMLDYFNKLISNTYNNNSSDSFLSSLNLAV